MDLTAKFSADFSSFYSAVAKAKTELEKFESTSDQVTASLGKMGDSLSGREVIQNATLMVKAIEDLGGATKLTDQELRKVGATVGEASAKMAKMGIEVPKSFKDISKAAEGVKEPTESWGSSLLNVTNIVRGFIGLQVVQYFKDAAAAGVEWASSMANLRAKTDLTYPALQILQDVSIATGTSLETLAKSVQVLQQRIGEGTARKGIQELGLSFDAIKAMDPASQFAAIASALARIKDPTERAARAAEIFGGSWREVMPALRADLSEIATATKLVGDSQIEAADRASARWDKFWNDQKKGWAAWAGDLVLGVEKGMSSWELANQRAAAIRARGAEGLVTGAGGTPALPAAPTMGLASGPQTNIFTDPSVIGNIRIAGQTLDEQAKSIDRAAKAATDYAKSIENTTKPINDWVAHMYSGTLQMRHSVVMANEMLDTLDNFKGRFKGAEMFPEPPAGTLEAWKKQQTAITETLPIMTKFGSQMKQFFGKDFGALIVQGIAGGGDAVKAALTGFGNLLFSPTGAFGESLSKNITNLFGPNGMMGKIGGAVSSMVPVIGSLVGPAIEGITALGKKLFGKSEESAKVSPLRDEFFKLQGGLEALNPKVLALGGNLGMVQAVMNAKTVEEYNAAIANLTGLFDVQEDAVLALTEAASRYGFTLEELGPALQAQQLDEQAKELYKDWEVLNAAGIDTVLIAERMSDSINSYLIDAIKMGVEVPEAMRPMLEKMIEMGQLTDGSGNKIDDLEKAGVTFSMTMSEGFKALITEVKNLSEVLKNGLGRAVDETSDKIGRIPRKVTVETEYKETGNRPGSGASVPGYQTGTDGKFVDFGTGTLAMLHGKEAIIPENATIAGGASMAGGAPVSVTIDARGALFGGPGDDQKLAGLVERALTAKWGLQHNSRAA